MLRVSPLPCSRLVIAIARFASLHASLNQGASVFPHLFGFRGVVIVIFFTTPVATASSKINYSTCVALSLLLAYTLSTIALKFLIKPLFPVTSFHFYADVA